MYYEEKTLSRLMKIECGGGEVATFQRVPFCHMKLCVFGMEARYR